MRRPPAPIPATAKILASLAVFGFLLPACRLPDSYKNQYQPEAGGEPTTVLRAQPVEGREALFPVAAALNVPSQPAGLDDTARFLAGLPGNRQESLAGARNSAAWQRHQGTLDRMWSDFQQRHELPIRSWAGARISDLQSSQSLFYPFSGPDFLFAQAFFPHCDTMVLCGLEPCEPLPPLQQLSGGELESGLQGLVTSLSTVMQFSFFITKDMRRDLVSTRFRGVIPVILTFMARSGCQIESVDPVRLDPAGAPMLVSGGNAPGVMIRARGPNGGLKRVFYFRQDLSDESLSFNGPFLRFVSSLGYPPAFVKSASYLMHEGGFSVIRSYLVQQCRGIVQDPSGVPYSQLLAAGAQVQLFGNYQGTLDMFSEHQQPDLIQAYRSGAGQPIDFGVGYLFNPGNTCLMVARPRR